MSGKKDIFLHSKLTWRVKCMHFWLSFQSHWNSNQHNNFTELISEQNLIPVNPCLVLKLHYCSYNSDYSKALQPSLEVTRRTDYKQIDLEWILVWIFLSMIIFYLFWDFTFTKHYHFNALSIFKPR